MNELFDAKESLSLQAREESLFQRLPTLIENSKVNSEHYAAHFSGLEPTLANNREGLAKFPITRKFNVPNQQQLKPPFGGLNSVAIVKWRVFFSLLGLYMRLKRMRPISGVWGVRFTQLGSVRVI